MELFLNYKAYQTAEEKYARVQLANDQWKENNKDAIEAVTKNANAGFWEKKFEDKTTEITTIFLDYCSRVEKMNTTFENADHYVFYLFNMCWMLPIVLEYGATYEIRGECMNSDVAEDIMYDSTYHDTIIDGCSDIETKTDEEIKLMLEIPEMMKGLQVVDKTFLNDDFTKMKTGFRKQKYMMTFAKCFQDYVNKVNEFNTDISSQFASIVGVLSGFPVFKRDRDNKAYVDEHYAQIDGVYIHHSDLFDTEGLYGGDQGHPIYTQAGHYDENGVLVDYNEDLFAFIRSHPGFENYSNDDIYKYLQKMNSQGCSYVAGVNSIIRAYEDKPEEFEKKYGFPLKENGDYNYDKLFFDYYSFSDGKVFIHSPEAKDAYVDSMLQYYEDDPELFGKKYGVPLYKYTESGNRMINAEAIEALEKEMMDKAKDDGVAEVSVNRTNDEAIENRYDAYLEAHGDTGKYSPNHADLTMESYQDLSDKGYTVVINTGDFNLYEEDGTRYNGDDTVGGHEMVVTGVTGDGRYEVSTWGKKLYVDPDELKYDDIAYYKVN